MKTFEWIIFIELTYMIFEIRIILYEVSIVSNQVSYFLSFFIQTYNKNKIFLKPTWKIFLSRSFLLPKYHKDLLWIELMARLVLCD